jgi:phosphoglucomutase
VVSIQRNDPLAGQLVPADRLVNVPRLVSAYYKLSPDPSDPTQAVAFGTSGHRGSSFDSSFNEAHILAITQAICEHRAQAGVDGPIFVGIDTHALSEPALATALEVFAANEVSVRVAHDRGYTPTPLVSHAILTHNAGRERGLADGVVITPSHNPPSDGGFKYNPPHGGPAGSALTSWIAERANRLLVDGLGAVKRVPYAKALRADTTQTHDFIAPYVDDLANVLELEAVRAAGLKIGVDPMGGASVGLWGPIAERHGLDIDIVNPRVDPTWSFMTLDHDGRIRMDCSSRWAMARMIALDGRYDIAFANDADADRHGIVAPSVGLMNPNHYLAVAIEHLFQTRTSWSKQVMIGKTVVTSAMIDRVAASLGRDLAEVPVGFKYFVELLGEGRCGFAGEESAGASLLRTNGATWTTDKDGVVLGLLAAEITARRERDPGELYQALTERFGAPVYERLDAPATREQKAALKALTPEAVGASSLAGDPVTRVLTRAPWGDTPIGGLRVETEHAWFAARPSGTEELYKIYAESFRGEAHLRRIQEEAQAIVQAAFAKAGS